MSLIHYSRSEFTTSVTLTMPVIANFCVYQSTLTPLTVTLKSPYSKSELNTMFIITNRNFQEHESPEKKFGERPNEAGASELRMAEANKIDNKWQVEVFPNTFTQEGGEKIYASEAIFLREQARMKAEKRNCLFFVHGFNTNFKAALEMGHDLETKYSIDVVMFTWPSDGADSRRLSDQAKGILSYRSDKREAKDSVGALYRCFKALRTYLDKYSESACNQSFNLACHSMGNYLLEQLVRSDFYSDETVFFDNICLLAADVNNKDHDEWVSRLAFRKRLYITINENDHALFASRAKFGEQQLARLGHWILNLSARNAFYIDLTDCAGKSHDYFNDEDLLKKHLIKELFTEMFHGLRADKSLEFYPSLGTYQIPD